MDTSRIKRLFTRVVVNDYLLEQAAKVAWEEQVAFEAKHPVAHDETIRLRALLGRMRQRVAASAPESRLLLAIAATAPKETP